MKHLTRTPTSYRVQLQQLRARCPARLAAASATITLIAGMFLTLSAVSAGAATIVSAGTASSWPPAHAAVATKGTPIPALTLPYDGTDPAATGCANSAVTVNSTPVNHGGVNFGTLQLKWSTSCKTNWGKFTGNGGIGNVSVWVYRQADNKWCGDQSGTGCNAAWWPSSAYSNQLYGCNYQTLAQVEIWNNGSPFWVDTPLEGGC